MAQRALAFAVAGRPGGAGLTHHAGMKVLNLQCERGHGFEGWFGSEADYASQCERGLVECPLCASRLISRLPSAPRLNLGAAREPRQIIDNPYAKRSPSAHFVARVIEQGFDLPVVDRLDCIGLETNADAGGARHLA